MRLEKSDRENLGKIYKAVFYNIYYFEALPDSWKLSMLF